MKSIHPFEPFIPANATRLIIGTIPPERFCIEGKELNSNDVKFYYGSDDNSFWKIIGEDILKKPFENGHASDKPIQQRKKYLTEMNLGITDIVSSCNRKNHSSTDKDLMDIEHKDLRAILEENPQIDTLIYTSGFVKSQVNKIFKKWHSKLGATDKEFTVKIIETKPAYKVIVLYSPSPSALRGLGKYGEEKRKKQYLEILHAKIKSDQVSPISSP